MPDCLAGAARTASGRVILYAAATGARYERGDEQAAEMVRSGVFLVTDPGSLERTADTHEALAPAAFVAPAAPVSVAPSRKRK